MDFSPPARKDSRRYPGADALIASEAGLVWRHKGRNAAPTRSCAICLHRLIVRPAPALGRNPGDIAVRILDVAGFAVDAVLGIDHELLLRALFHPFVDASRAIAVRRASKDLEFGSLLQVEVGHLEVDRLILLMVGVGKKYRGKPVEGGLAVELRRRDRL